jgi:putative ABC transport system permease protein
MQAQAPPVGHRSRLEGLGRLVRHPAGAMIVRNMVRRPWRTGLSIVGMAAAMAIVILGHFVRDAIEEIERSAFSLALRGDLIVSMIEPVHDDARHALARLPGVIAVESGREAAVRLRHGHVEERARIQGGEATGHLRRVMDVDGREAVIPLEGLMLTDRLAAKLGARPGDVIEVQVLEGRMPIRHVAVCCTVRDMMGLNAYMERGALNRLMGEGDFSSQFTLALEQGTEAQTLQATRSLPRVAGTFSKATLRANMQQVSGRNVRIMSTVMTAFAAVIAVGIIYNAMRIALAERSWELASLRVLGFRRAEVSGLLLGEMAIGVVLALPLGMALGWLLVHGVAQLLASDQFLFPVVIQPRTYALAALSVGMAALATSAVVRRHIDHLDLVAVLKTRE